MSEFPVQERSVLQSDTTRYLVLNFTGEGSFGKVAQCLDLETKEVVAIKILKESNQRMIQREIEMLQAISSLDVDSVCIVRFIESFTYCNLCCVAFEILDKSVWDLLRERRTLTLHEIRPMIYQLMVALDALRSQGIMHTDLKPDNIMLVDHENQPYRMKLIDFGLALPQSRAQTGTMMQPTSFRAPEVYLGLPVSTAVDVWSVGCIMASMFFGRTLFPGDCPHGWMNTVMRLLEQPKDWQLKQGMYSYKYFILDSNQEKPGWRLRTDEEYNEVTAEEPDDSGMFVDWCENLEDAVLKGCTETKSGEWKDRHAFLSLLKACLCVDPNKRITPMDALSHSFLTMEHIADDADYAYADTAFDFMALVLETESDCDNEDTETEDPVDPPAAESENPATASSQNEESPDAAACYVHTGFNSDEENPEENQLSFQRQTPKEFSCSNTHSTADVASEVSAENTTNDGASPDNSSAHAAPNIIDADDEEETKNGSMCGMFCVQHVWKFFDRIGRDWFFCQS